MKIKLDLNKSLEENASDYYDAAKKAKKKIQGVEKTITEFRKKQEKFLAKAEETKSRIRKLSLAKGFWFEKFKWFLTSEGFLVVGGRDATTNEILIKKHLHKEDIVFHTEMQGSPFVIIKKHSQEEVSAILGKEMTLPTGIGKAYIDETACFTLVHSKAWKMGLGGAEVFYVEPSQISKEANSGEYIAKGAFMIRGKRNFVKADFDFGIGVTRQKVKKAEESEKEEQEVLLSGPLQSLQAYCDVIQIIEPGREKASAIAKLVRAFFRTSLERDVHTDEIIKLLPSGGCHIAKRRKTKAELGL